MTLKYNIAVAGAGIGGLAAAAFLARDGHAVTVFDQFDAPAPVGSGLVMQPIGLMVLNALGVGDRAMGLGNKIHDMIGVEATSGRKVLNVTYDKERTRFGLAMHRASLFDCVHHAAITAGATIVSATPITASKNRTAGRHLFSNDTDLGPFDLVIDGSGVDSPLSPMQPIPLSYGALWGVVDTPIAPQNTLAQCYRKASTMVGILPVGFLPNDQAHKTALFWSLPRDSFEDWRMAPFADWKKQASSLWPDFAPYAELLTDHSDLTMARYSHGTLRNPTDDRLAFIGDAAHRTSPQLGQGANMALLDAMALAHSLRHKTVEMALADYATLRRWHVRIYQVMSRAFTPFYQSDSTILPILRDHLLAPVSDLPVIRTVLQKMVSGELTSLGQLANSDLNAER
ncbi:NAD(P)/FAD-dependent oxidoreductase [Amylibacter sp. IMCC11727]|uniref:FAD-dependent oxidoreductase n=1 Tax=Amylibacter sp. IMCC11727 TaxID=3039851 RepID=UPI00244E2549|nr:NAD(P)/FAD-dependent oxidoreductase [Amylibacter sp. IMCC11727]WGI22589.1 NAD(P)/FAD-dependent oxidoreductase [Amylibacter sp. IMCC11727]